MSDFMPFDFIPEISERSSSAEVSATGLSEMYPTPASNMVPAGTDRM